MKKILIIATAILVFLLIMIAAISSMMRRANNQGQNPTPTPTTAPFTSSPINPQQPTNPSITTGALAPVSAGIIEEGRASTPFETDTFKFEYSEQNGGFVVTEKAEGGRADFEQWISEEKGLPELSTESQAVTIIPESFTATGDGKIEGEVDGLLELLNLIFTPVELTPQSNPTPTSAPQSSTRNNNRNSNANVSSNAPTGQGGYVYYAQCNGYGNVSLPGGCNLCEAGCGPTTVSMIAASYLGKEYTPKTLVDLYDDRGYYLSCAGSRYSDAKAALESLGLKTTSYLTYNLETSDVVASDFKKYLDAGWTIFTLANYCDKGCGHYFWVTEVKNGDILAYDPYYGKNTKPPYNENSRYPFPKYRIAFGVKK